jgi:hypothetical protein
MTRVAQEYGSNKEWYGICQVWPTNKASQRSLKLIGISLPSDLWPPAIRVRERGVAGTGEAG